MLILSKQSIGEGWREVQVGENIKTLDQWANISKGAWQSGQFMTQDNRLNLGKVSYRRPITKWTKFISFFAAFPKIRKYYWSKFVGINLLDFFNIK